MPSTGSMTPSHTAGTGRRALAGLSLHRDKPAHKHPVTGRQIPGEGLQGSCTAEEQSSTLPVLPGSTAPLGIPTLSHP